MNKETKLTLDELIRRKMQIMEAKKKRKSEKVYIDSLGGYIILTEPTREIMADITGMTDQNEANKYAIYNCVTEPSLKSPVLHEEYECAEPYDIVDKLFSYAEITQLSILLNELAGFDKGVKVIDEIKN